MAVTAEMVRDLREKTGAGILDCRKALSESAGDVEKAVDYLRKKGLASAAKKAGRVTAEGAVSSYIHAGGKIGVLLEVNCETDFVAKTDDFKNFVHDMTMHIAAANPQYVRREEVPPHIVNAEKQVYIAQARETKKPEKMLEKIAEGKLNKFFSEICMLEQPFIKDPDKSVEDMVASVIAKIGENVTIRRFSRYQLGEGIEKKMTNLKDEVEKQLNA